MPTRNPQTAAARIGYGRFACCPHGLQQVTNPLFYTYYNGTGDSVIDLAIAANEILGKIWRQQDAMYIVGFQNRMVILLFKQHLNQSRWIY